MKDQVLNIVKDCILEILPEVSEADIKPEISMRDLGANSIDRMEVVTMAMERLKIKVPVVEFTNVKSIGQLVDVYLNELQKAGI